MSGIRLVIAVSISQVLAQLGSVTAFAVLPTLIDEWHLTHAEGGLLSGVFFAGYVVSVPFLTALTDRYDACRIYLWATGLQAVALLGFGLMAHEMWLGSLFRILAGVGLAGSYMPGLKALADVVDSRMQSRATAIYTSSLTVGGVLSFAMSGAVAELLDWHWAFHVGAIGAAIGTVLSWAVLPKRPFRLPREEGDQRPLLDFRPALRNRASLAYTIGYTMHSWELFVQRSWVVAFLAFVAERHRIDPQILSPTNVAAVMGVGAVIGSMAGNELCMRFGRRRVIYITMALSMLLSATVGFVGPAGYLLASALTMVHITVIYGDSAALTAGALGSALPQYRGITMGLHSTLGFTGGFVGPLLFGWTLDVLGADTIMSWGVAFAELAVLMLIGMLTLRIMQPPDLEGDRIGR